MSSATWKQTFIKDMYGDTKDALQITKSAIVVLDLIQGRKANVKDGDTLNFSGMSSDQFVRVTQMLLNQGFNGTIRNGN